MSRGLPLQIRNLREPPLRLRVPLPAEISGIEECHVDIADDRRSERPRYPPSFIS